MSIDSYPFFHPHILDFHTPISKPLAKSSSLLNGKCILGIACESLLDLSEGLLLVSNWFAGCEKDGYGHAFGDIAQPIRAVP